MLSVSQQAPDQDQSEKLIDHLLEKSPPQTDDLRDLVLTKLETFIKYVDKLDEKYVEIVGPINETEEMAKHFARLIFNMKALQVHFRLITGVLTAESEEQTSSLHKEHHPVSTFYTNMTHATHVSLVPLHDALNTVIRTTFEELKEITTNFYVVKSGSIGVNKGETNLAQVQILASKLATVMEYLPGLVQTAAGDLFAQPKSAYTWKRLYDITDFKGFKDHKAVLASIKKLAGILNVANAVLYKCDKEKNDFVGALTGLYYMAAQDKAELRSGQYLADPKMDSAFKIWNLPDKGIVKELYKLRLPKIEYDKKIYVSRLFPQITKESVLKEYADGSLHTLKTEKFSAPDLTEKKEEILKTIFDKHSENEKVKIRILSPQPLIIKGQKREKMAVMMAEMKGKLFKKKETKDNINGVIIHIHGGGFVSMSSATHRNYLNLWAKALNMIIFSIDYRLAPEHPYPAALDDVWQGYNWLINYSESILGIPMENMILTGDSAGGNFVASLTLRAVREGVRLPDGIMLSYPALNLFPTCVVPSYFQAIDDVILPSNVLKLCLKAYIPEEFKPESDPFLSPVVASDELLSKLPPVRIISGTNDPLHDDIWKFSERLLRLKKDVRMTVYPELPHGFFTLDEMLEYDVVVNEGVNRIKELFLLRESEIKESQKILGA